VPSIRPRQLPRARARAVRNAAMPGRPPVPGPQQEDSLRRPGAEPPAAPVQDTALCSGSIPRSTGGNRPSPRVLRSSPGTGSYPHQAHQFVGSPDLRMAQVPPRIGRQRHGQIRQTDAAHLVAITIDRRNDMRVGFAFHRRQGRRDPARGVRAKIEPDHLRQVRRKADPRDRREHVASLFRRDRRTIRKTRIPARRRIFLPGHPPVHPHQGGAQRWVVINRIERLLAASAVDRVGVGQRQGAGGMLRAREVVKARGGGQRDVLRSLRVGVDQRGIAPPILSRRVGERSWALVAVQRAVRAGRRCVL
jgi:hypothetical protein